MSRKTFLLPRLGVLAAIVFWGISFVATKAAVAQISPAALIFARSGIGCLVLVGLLTLRGQPLSVPKESFPALAAMGFIGVAFHQMLQAYALTLTSAVHAGWLIGVTPIWSAIFAALILHERLGARKLAGLAIGFSGAVVVITRGRLTGGMFALPSTRGDLLMLGSTLNWALYSVIGHRTIRKLGSARATTAAMGFGWAMLLPFFLYRANWREFAKLSPAGWGAVLFLGVCCSGLGYLFWYAALEKIEASQVAAFLHLEPVVTLVAAVVLLGESVTAATILGGVLVVIGVSIVQRSPASDGSPSSRDRARRSS